MCVTWMPVIVIGDAHVNLMQNQLTGTAKG